MMAWILMSLLASYASGAVVAFSPDADGAQQTADAKNVPTGEVPDGTWEPPKP